MFIYFLYFGVVRGFLYLRRFFVVFKLERKMVFFEFVRCVENIARNDVRIAFLIKVGLVSVFWRCVIMELKIYKVRLSG